MSSWMLKNSENEHDGSFTFAAISFFVVTTAVVMSCFDNMVLGPIEVHFRSVDSALALGYLAATFSTYIVRRTTKDMNSAGQ